jgi:ABC-type phosphate transport system substrate-binding protein
VTRRHWFLLLVVVGVALARPGIADVKDGAFVVIVHPSNRFDSLTRSKVSLLFLRKVSRWPWGAEVEPVDLAHNLSVRIEFTEHVLKITERDLDQYWIDQTATRGVSRPVQVTSAAAAKAIVAARPGAIAYIPAAELDRTVKVLRVDP